MTINIVSHAEGTSFVANKDNLLENQPTEDIYKMLMAKLPLKMLVKIREFEDMLKKSEEVLTAVVIKAKHIL